MQKDFLNNINHLIGYRTQYLLDEINILCDQLKIQIPSQLSINALDAIFLKGITMQDGFKKTLMQLEKNHDKYLSIRYKINGKQHTLKSFGKISNINHQTILKIIQLVALFRLVKQIDELSYLASGVRFLTETMEN